MQNLFFSFQQLSQISLNNSLSSITQPQEKEKKNAYSCVSVVKITKGLEARELRFEKIKISEERLWQHHEVHDPARPCTRCTTTNGPAISTRLASRHRHRELSALFERHYFFFFSMLCFSKGGAR